MDDLTERRNELDIIRKICGEKYAATTLAISHLFLGDILVRVLQNLRTAWITTMMVSRDNTVAKLDQVVEQMNPGKMVDVTTLIGTNNLFTTSAAEEYRWDEILVCLFYSGMEEVSVVGTGRPHGTHEQEDTTGSCAEA